MCGRLALYAAVETLIELFLLGLLPEVRARYNIAPTQPLPVVVFRDGQRQLEHHRWGFVPRWVPDPRRGRPLINARSETAATKRTFKSAFAHRRLLVPASGFYEWERSGKARLPWYFTREDGRPLALAGLWETWEDADGEVLTNATILTTAANQLMAPIHDRMPVILPESAWEQWLDPDGDTAALQTLLAPWAGGGLRRFRVGTHVNNARNDDPTCIEPLQADLFGG